MIQGNCQQMLMNFYQKENVNQLLIKKFNVFDEFGDLKITYQPAAEY